MGQTAREVHLSVTGTATCGTTQDGHKIENNRRSYNETTHLLCNTLQNNFLRQCVAAYSTTALTTAGTATARWVHRLDAKCHTTATPTPPPLVSTRPAMPGETSHAPYTIATTSKPTLVLAYLDGLDEHVEVFFLHGNVYPLQSLFSQQLTDEELRLTHLARTKHEKTIATGLISVFAPLIVHCCHGKRWLLGKGDQASLFCRRTYVPQTHTHQAVL